MLLRSIGREVLTWNRMIRVSDTYSLEDLCDMSDEEMAALLGFYGPNKVPTLKELRGPEEFDGFDGSFGFFVGWG